MAEESHEKGYRSSPVRDWRRYDGGARRRKPSASAKWASQIPHRLGGRAGFAEATRFEGTPPVITALAAGELDIGPLAFSSFGLAIQNAHMDDLRVICDEIQDGVAGHGTNEFMVRNDSPIKTVADLKGKVLATNAMGSAVDIAMRAMLRRSGLEANRDYTVVEAPFPAMRAMLAERKADLISAVPPFSLDQSSRHGPHAIYAARRLRHHSTHDVDGPRKLHPEERRRTD